MKNSKEVPSRHMDLYRLNHVQSWRTSGLSQAQYCREYGLREPIFSSWVRQDHMRWLPKGEVLVATSGKTLTATCVDMPLTIIPILPEESVVVSEGIPTDSSQSKLILRNGLELFELPRVVEAQWLICLLRGLP